MQERERDRDRDRDRDREGGGEKRKKYCRFCKNKIVIDYKDDMLMSQLISSRGKILPKRVTGTCAKHQRDVAQAIKRSRYLSIIPYIKDVEI
jgi:small subunit ribosomal protein S18